MARLATADLDDQPCRDFQALDRKGIVDTAFEALPRIARKIELATRGRRAHRVEERNFQEPFGRVVVRAGRLSADHAAEPEHSGLIEYDGHLAVGLVGLAVEGIEALARFGEPGADRSLDLGRIVDVRWSPEVHGQPVGDVDEC